MKRYIVIPARLESERLPGKMLLDETGTPLIIHTYLNAARQADNNWHIVIATDSVAIEEEAKKRKIPVVMTGPATCGTHRMYLASQHLGDGVYVNVQGDTPLADLSKLETIGKLAMGSTIICTHYPKNPTMIDYSETKVVFAANGGRTLLRPMYYSREPIPHGAAKWYINSGLYAMSRDTLQMIYNGSQAIFNASEKLEQLLWLEQGYKVRSMEVAESFNIDTRGDYERFKNHIGG